MNPNSEEILQRIRVALQPWGKDIEERRMFGGTCFLFKGKICVGQTKERLIVRIPAERMTEITQSPFVKPMDFTGKPMKEFIFVTTEGFETEEKLQEWAEMGVAHPKTKLK